MLSTSERECTDRETIDAKAPKSGGLRKRSALLAALVAATLAQVPTTARADGCTVLLCLAGNWRSIAQCVPPVRKALRDLALGRAFPLCGFASAPSISWSSPEPTPALHGTSAASSGNASSQATLRWAQEDFCPPQYRTAVELESGTSYQCNYVGAIEVTINGQLWNRTWWNMTGDSVTEWTESARRSVPQTSADDRFERDYEAWRAQQVTPPVPAAPAAEGGA